MVTLPQVLHWQERSIRPTGLLSCGRGRARTIVRQVDERVADVAGADLLVAEVPFSTIPFLLPILPGMAPQPCGESWLGDRASIGSLLVGFRHE